MFEGVPFFLLPRRLESLDKEEGYGRGVWLGLDSRSTNEFILCATLVTCNGANVVSTARHQATLA